LKVSATLENGADPTLWPRFRASSTERSTRWSVTSSVRIRRSHGRSAVGFLTAVNIRKQAHDGSYSPKDPRWFGAINPWKGFRVGTRRARIEAGPGRSRCWPRPRPWAVLLFAAQALSPSHSLGPISDVPHHAVSFNRTHRGRVPPDWRGAWGRETPGPRARGPGVSWRCASGVDHAPATPAHHRRLW